MSEGIIFGFAAEPHKKGKWLTTPATLEEGVVTCADCSGFMGFWTMRDGGVFFPSETGEIFCEVALGKADEYGDGMEAQSEVLRGRAEALNLVSDAVSDLLYYDRKEDEDFPPQRWVSMFQEEVFDIEELGEHFKNELRKGLKSE